jgi:predicted aldo/keto reductase-like oxidoreductase
MTIYGIERHNIDNCIECGDCAHACGRRIAILDWLKAAHRLLCEHK